AQQFVLGAAYARQSAAAEAVRRVPIALLLRRLMPQGLCLRSSSSRVFAARRGGLVRGLAFGRGGFRGLLWRFERGLVDPARLDPRIEDQLLDLLPAQAEVGEDAVVMDGLLLLVLPLGPAGEVVGGTIRQVLDRPDVVLAESDQHGRGHAWHLGKLVGDAERLAFGIELGLDLLQVLARAR